MLRRVLVVAVVAVVVGAGVVLASAALDEPSREYRDAIVIEAPRSAIWAALTDFERYDEWNPYMTSAEGTARVGSTVHLTLEGVDGDADTRAAEVLIVRPARKLEWRSRLFAPGVLDRERIFRVLPLANHRFRVVHEIRVEGVLSPLTDGDEDRAGVRRMLAALEQRVSGNAAP